MPTSTFHRLRVTLLGAEPPIHRVLEVPSTLDLERLHVVIQLAFGWDFAHLWGFDTPVGRFGEVQGDHESPASTATVAQVLPQIGERLRYTYDFGDSWDHDVLVEDVGEVDESVTYPRCLEGARACPPEDCGGVWGYEYLVAVLADPDHPEHEERLEWLGLASADDFDPEAFDLVATNAALARLRHT